ncbi:MAG: glutamine synthetase beta-grasp domain-containing protein, partial [Alphaproteobacteria bacterium]
MAKSTAKLKVAKAPAKAARGGQNYSDFFKLIKEHNIEYVSFRFTDLRGKLQHTAQHISTVNEDLLEDGIMFDGSSIAGWKAINESDMILQPDISTAVLDPFSALPTLDVFCDVYEPSTGQPYTRDPRSIARAAEKYLKSTGIADTGFFGPEAEFFIFDDVRIEVSMNRVSYEIDSIEGPYNSGREYDGGNMAHRPGIKGGYFPVQPVDSSNDMRGEMTSVLAQMGVPVEKHHHEVAPAQVELGVKYSTLVNSADNMQLYKYVV